MPNHFLVIGLCARDYEALERRGMEGFDFSSLENQNLCEIVCPMPADLESIVAQNQPCRYRHVVTKEFLIDVNGPPASEANQFEKVLLTESEICELREKHGAADWYEWAVENWGTKWGAYGLKVSKLGGDLSPVLIEFQAAWCPPSPRVMRAIDDYLCVTYCLKNIKWIGHDPGTSTTLDIDLS